jgi:hypothetical protein
MRKGRMDQKVQVILAKPNQKATSMKKACDQILTYGYVKPRDQWFPTEETPD